MLARFRIVNSRRPCWRATLANKTITSIRSLSSSVPTIRAELVALFQPVCDGLQPSIVEVQNRPDADFALTSAMELFRNRKGKYATPKDAAASVLDQVRSSAGNKFSFSQANFYVNVTLSNAFLIDRIRSILLSTGSDSVSAPAIDRKMKVLIDFSSPNIAKQMHVGHLRSTVIGNCLATMHEFVGHETIRVNHIGDWGTQFGTLLAHMLDIWGADAFPKIKSSSMAELTKLYQDSKKRTESDPSFALRAKQTTVELQSRKNETLTALWTALVDLSKQDFNRMYDRLQISRIEDWYVGESFYQDKVDDAIKDLQTLVTTSDSDASVLLFTNLPEAKIKKEDRVDEIPLILKKSDGGVGYDATDVAAIKHRLQVLHAEKLLYVTDAGQSLHFALVFQAARMAGWTRLFNGEENIHQDAALFHVPFGVVRKVAGGRIKTREAGAETLDSLLDNANARMLKILQSKRSSGKWTSEELSVLERLSKQLGIACVIFSELKTSRTMDYEFNVDRMCSPDGDSAVYIIHVLQKIRRQLSVLEPTDRAPPYDLEGASSKERALALNLAKFQDVVSNSLSTLNPHLLCLHALSVAGDVSSFLEDLKEPILEANPALNFVKHRGLHRYALVLASSKILEQHLQLLGLKPFLTAMEPSLAEIRSWKHVEVL